MFTSRKNRSGKRVQNSSSMRVGKRKGRRLLQHWKSLNIIFSCQLCMGHSDLATQGSGRWTCLVTVMGGCGRPLGPLGDERRSYHGALSASGPSTQGGASCAQAGGPHRIVQSWLAWPVLYPGRNWSKVDWLGLLKHGGPHCVPRREKVESSTGGRKTRSFEITPTLQ